MAFMQIPLVLGAAAELYAYKEAEERVMQWEDGITRIILLYRQPGLDVLFNKVPTASTTSI